MLGVDLPERVDVDAPCIEQGLGLYARGKEVVIPEPYLHGRRIDAAFEVVQQRTNLCPVMFRGFDLPVVRIAPLKPIRKFSHCKGCKCVCIHGISRGRRLLVCEMGQSETHQA